LARDAVILTFAKPALNIRVADVRACSEEWSRNGAEVLTEPKDHRAESRCYMLDHDGYLIEVGQSRS
jgi:lactoylglutathione lyase